MVVPVGEGAEGAERLPTPDWRLLSKSFRRFLVFLKMELSSSLASMVLCMSMCEYNFNMPYNKSQSLTSPQLTRGPHPWESPWSRPYPPPPHFYSEPEQTKMMVFS